MLFQRFFSVDRPKAVKAQKYGWLNAINYMAPHRLAGVGNLCPNASPGGIALCLGEHSGNAALYPAVLKSRIAKAQLMMRDRPQFLKEMTAGIRRARATAKRQKLKLCVRLNGATDIAWERLAPAIFADNADLQFVDYTKSVKRALEHAAGQFPANYHLTFSRSGTGEAQCLQAAGVGPQGGNVAVVFAGEFPEHYLGHRVINGDAHDLRHLDPRGVVIGLTPKGNRAKRDVSGFVVRAP